MHDQTIGEGTPPGTPPAPWSAREFLPVVTIIGVVALLLWPVLFGGQTLFFRDLHLQHMGTARLLGDGGLTSGLLWDSYLNGGQPLLANPNRFLLYPSRVLYVLIPAVAGLNWEIALHMIFGGLGALFLSRRLGVSGAGSAVAGLAYAVGGLSISLSSHLGRFLAFHWLPWVVLVTDLAFARRGRGRWPWLGVLPVFVALPWMTGVAEQAAATMVVAAVWVAVVRPRASSGWFVGAAVVGLLLIGLGLAAIQVVPAGEMVFGSERTQHTDSARFLSWSLNPLRLPATVVPGFLGPIDSAKPLEVFWGSALVEGGGLPYFVSLYFGASVVLLAAVGFVGGRRHPWLNLRWLLVSIAVIGFVVAFGRYVPVIGLVLTKIPGFNLVRYPVKAVLLAALPAALLAGHGVDVVLGGTPDRARWIRKSAAILAGCALLLICLLAWRGTSPLLNLIFPGFGEVARTGLMAPMLQVAGVLAVIALVAAGVGRVKRPLLAALVTGIVAADLVLAAMPMLPMAPAPVFADRPVAVEAIHSLIGDGRFFRDPEPGGKFVVLQEDRAWPRAAWFAHELSDSLATTWMIPMTFHLDMEGLAGNRIAELSRLALQAGWEDRVRLFRAAGVELVMTANDIRVDGLDFVRAIPLAVGLDYRFYRVTPTPPMVYWVGDELVVNTADEAKRTLLSPDFDPTREVVREGDSTRGGLNAGLRNPLQPSVEIWSQHIVAPSQGVIVAAIPWHRDLVVEVDGRRVRAERVNFAFTGVEVEAGEHSLRVRFAPRAVFWGGAISCLSLGGCAALSVVLRRRSRIS